MNCQNCGAQIPENAVFCPHCGYKSEKNATSSTESNYLKYCDRVKKMKFFSMIMQGLAVFITLMLIFLPIYRCTYEPSLDDIESWEQFEDLYEEALKNDGKVTKSFSLYDDLNLWGKNLKGDFTEPENILGLVSGSGAIFQILCSFALICTTIPQFFKNYREYNDVKDSTLLKYNELQKNGIVPEKHSFLDFYFILFYAATDVFFGGVVGRIPSSFENPIIFRNMQNLCGVSGSIVLVIIAMVAYLIIRSKHKKEENEMLFEITKEQYNNQK